jgi:hypothetical protein
MQINLYVNFEESDVKIEERNKKNGLLEPH